MFAFAEAVEELDVKLLHPAARAPERSREGDAGYDLRCLEDFVLGPGERLLMATGVAIALPDGVAGLVLPRSGLAIRHGVTTLNAPGLVDPTYRGEVKVILHNAGSEPYEGRAGDRVAQLLLVTYCSPSTRVVGELAPSSDGRADSGFGSSGR